ncbi:DUF4870 family protein [Parendozoicomonas haliclonae]|uniref:Transmembrane protein n=1 Tax=Parendozoicomonas haliclonae TaxID=1960125 RepID=A0A1X7AHJ1_9GAMM|nr:hypothetical protein [Parendozoicomonas haliclonae]SMA40677.1 hypothetical protein EHSB41UT_01222 [Parendozoicomonas haliclonae]
MSQDFSVSPERTPIHIAYALMAVSVFTAFPVFIAAIVAWVNRGRESDYLLLAHYDWIVRTFWINLLVGVIGFILTFILIGWLVLFLNQIWLIYRVAMGWYQFSNDRLP